MLCDDVGDYAELQKDLFTFVFTERCMTSFLKGRLLTDISSLSFSAVGFIFYDPAAKLVTELFSNDSQKSETSLVGNQLSQKHLRSANQEAVKSEKSITEIIPHMESFVERGHP